MAPTEAMKPEPGGLGPDGLHQVVDRLHEVRRRCVTDPVAADPQFKAIEALDAVLGDLGEGQEPGSATMGIEELDLRLATIEALFESMGSPNLARVIASIRSTLSEPTEGPSPEEEPPPPRRFAPPPGAAVRRRRPRPSTGKRRAPAKAATRSGGSRWFKFLILTAVATSIASFVYLRQVEPEITPSNDAGQAPVEKQAVSRLPASAIPTMVPAPASTDDDFDPLEEEMANFTLEINLAESSLRSGDLRGSLRHFAAAAAIDRFHRRVISMGKSLIAALLQEADLAGDSGDWELAGRRIEDARNIAHGLRLDDSAVDTTAQKLATLTRFEDIEPGDAEGLRDAIGRPVRLILKTDGLIIGRLLEINDGILLLDVYSGVKGGGVEFSTSILASTIREIRVYDAKRPEEIMVAD